MVRQGRLTAIKNSLDLLKNAHCSVKAFAVAVDKQAASPNDPVEHTGATLSMLDEDGNIARRGELPTRGRSTMASSTRTVG